MEHFKTGETIFFTIFLVFFWSTQKYRPQQMVCNSILLATCLNPLLSLSIFFDDRYQYNITCSTYPSLLPPNSRCPTSHPIHSSRISPPPQSSHIPHSPCLLLLSESLSLNSHIIIWSTHTPAIVSAAAHPSTHQFNSSIDPHPHPDHQPTGKMCAPYIFVLGGGNE